MNSNDKDNQNVQADLIRLLVAKTLQKYGVTAVRPDLTEQERNHLKETIHSLKDRTAYLVNHLQRKITENEPPVFSSQETGERLQTSQPHPHGNKIKFRKRDQRK